MQLHRHSLNIRHLGRVRAASKDPSIKKIILSVCAGRVVKDDLKELFRIRTVEVTAPSHHREFPTKSVKLLAYRKVIVKFLNQLHGHSKTSSEYWATLANRINEKFQGCLEEEVPSIIRRSDI